MPPRPIEGADDFTTRASKRLAYDQATTEKSAFAQDFNRKFSPPRKKDYHTMDMKKLVGPNEAHGANAEIVNTIVRVPTADDIFVSNLSNESNSSSMCRSDMRSSKRSPLPRSRSFSSRLHHDNPCTQTVPKANAYEAGSSMLMSSFDEAASEGVLNSSGFNDISCISYADRTVNDDKDCTVSRIDVSKSSINLSGSTAINNSADKSTETLNKSAQSKSKLDSSNDSDTKN